MDVIPQTRIMSVKNEYNKEAKAKIKELAEGIDFNMFFSKLDEIPIHAIPMSTKKVDALGDIWFLSSIKHDHVQNILASSEVQLAYGKPNSMEFLSLFGQARIVEDRRIFEDLYQSTDDSWFDGVNDPNLRAIAVTPMEAQYWEPKSNKAVSLFKMAYGALTGSKVDVSREGELRP